MRSLSTPWHDPARLAQEPDEVRHVVELAREIIPTLKRGEPLMLLDQDRPDRWRWYITVATGTRPDGSTVYAEESGTSTTREGAVGALELVVSFHTPERPPRPAAEWLDALRAVLVSACAVSLWLSIACLMLAPTRTVPLAGLAVACYALDRVVARSERRARARHNAPTSTRRRATAHRRAATIVGIIIGASIALALTVCPWL